MELYTPDRYDVIRNEYENWNNTHRQGGFMQSLRWAGVKKDGWGSSLILSRDSEGAIRGSMLVLIKKVPIFGWALLYAPRGPVCDPYDRETLEDLMTGVDLLKKKHRAYMFRMDPYVLASDDRYIAMAREMGFEFTPDMGDFTTIQTRNNYMLNIEGKTPDEVMAGFHQKWRYNIRVAMRHGVECKVCDKSHIDEFYALMQKTGERDEFRIRPKSYFVKMLDELGDYCRLYLCFYEGRAISGAVTTQCGGKTCYVYGASDNELRNVMPNHLMQWTMIQWAIEGGCFVYDFQGIPGYTDENSHDYGIYKFKKGFNGEVVEFAGEFDRIYSKLRKRIVDVSEKVYNKVRR